MEPGTCIPPCEDRSELRYLEQWDLSTIMTDNVDIPNSQASFDIPLVDIPICKSLHITLSATYNSGESKTNGLLGNGWSLQIPDDYIVVNQKESVFPETHEYYLMINTQMQKLNRRATNSSNDGLQHFQIREEKDIHITYNPQREQWIIDTKNLKATYGKADDSSGEAVQRSLFWESWRGPGLGDKDELKSQVQAWYVVSREEKHSLKKKLVYEYHIEEEHISNGMSYTSAIQLKSIMSSDTTMRLDLNYGIKNRGEYSVQNPESHERFLMFPVFLQSKLFLQSYSLTTDRFRQNIRFDYLIQSENVRKLVSITQLYTAINLNEELFQFDYDDELQLLVQIRRGNERSIKYSYVPLQIPLLNFGEENNVLKHLTTRNTQITIGSDFSAMAYHINTEKVYIRVLNKQLTSTLARLETTSSSEVDSFALLSYPNSIAVFVETNTTRFLSTFSRNVTTLQWAQTPETFLFDKKDTFRHSQNIMAVAKNKIGQMEVFDVDDKEKNAGFKKTVIVLRGRPVQRFVIQDRAILAYDGQSLFSLSRNEENVWNQNPDIFSVHSGEEEFVNDVYMDDEFAKYFKDQVRISGLQMVKNMVLLGIVRWEENMFSCKVNLLLLDQNYERAVMQEYFTGNEKFNKNITQFVKDYESEGNTMKFRYEDVGDGRWQAKLFNISGKIDEDIDKLCNDAPQGCTDEEKLEIKVNETIKFNKEEEEFLRKILILDPSPCLEFQLDSKGAKTNSTVLEMQGSSWHQKNKDDNLDAGVVSNMALAKDFVLESLQGQNNTVFRLFKQNRENGGKLGGALEQFQISSNGSFAVGYPSYVAFQQEPWLAPVIIPLRETGNTGNRLVLPDGETLMTMSNAETILTLRENYDASQYPFTHELLSRRVNTLIPSESTFAVGKSEVQDNEEIVRIRTYSNSFVSNQTALTQENTVRVIPTGDPSYSGWFEQTTIIPIDSPSNATKVENWIDADGKIVRSKQIEFSEDVEEDEADKPDYKIVDISGGLEICQTFPYNVTNQMVSYFGFESYENPCLPGTNTSWVYSEADTIRNGNALTGESFLRIAEGQKLAISLIPNDQSNIYIASCWVRVSEEVEFQFESPVTYLKAHLATTEGQSFLGLYGEMKRERDGWLYLEVTMDLHMIRQNVYAEYYNLNQKRNSKVHLPPPEEVNFIISVEIDSGLQQNNIIEIDHVRFMPIQADLQVKVYSEINGNELASILSNGAIIRKVYNVHGREIANIDENGQIEQIISTTYVGQMFPIPNFRNAGRVLGLLGMKSDLVIRPEWGQLEKVEFSRRKWSTDKAENWKLSYWEISHIHPNDTNELTAEQVSSIFDSSSAAIRFDFRFLSQISANIQFSFQDGTLLELGMNPEQTNTCTLSLYSGLKVDNLPNWGEIIIFLENSTLWVWINGNLLLEEKVQTFTAPPWSKFSMKVTGLVEISNMIVLNSPQVYQEFFNGFGDRIQVIQLETEESVLVSETIYDTIGREAIKTKTGRVTKDLLMNLKSPSPLFTFRANFATNKNPNDLNSVFNTGILEGLVNNLHPGDEGFPYTRKIFMKDLLQESAINGLPGREFFAGGSFTKQHSRQSDVSFIRVVFPLSRGFTEKVVKEPNGSLKITIIDKNENEIAQYIRVPGFDHILTTFEYDIEGNLRKLLPPAYHEQAGSFSRTTPLPIGDEGLTEEEALLQAKLCTHFTYNDMNYLTRKMSPDTGIQEYKYDLLGNMRFMYSIDSQNGQAANIIYLLHSGKNQPVEIGYLPNEMNVQDLVKFENSTAIPNQVIHQRIIHSDTHSNPYMRGKVKLFMTYTTEQRLGLASAEHIPPPHQELLKFDSENNVVLKTSNAVHSGILTNLHKHYKGGKVAELQYPRNSKKEKSFNLMHSYDKVGRLTGLGTREDPNCFAKFSYSSSGQVIEEVIEPNTSSQFIRSYGYNSPGLLVEISDPFLSQSLAFTQDGYGQRGFGDGIIMKSIFNASWVTTSAVNSTDFQEWFKIPENEYAIDKTRKLCLSALKRLSFVDSSTLIPIRYLTYGDIPKLPLICSGSVGHELMKLVAEKLPPTMSYGHRYAYGNHQELTKAKYFSSLSDSIDPLQVYTFFKEIPDIETEQVSETIWDLLTDAGYIITDNRRRDDKTAAIGKEGTVSFFAFRRLESDLVEVDALAGTYTRAIMNLLFDIYSKNEAMIDLEAFKETFINFLGYRDTPTATLIINKAKQTAQKIYEMLDAKGYLSDGIPFLLNEAFVEKLASIGFESISIPIASVLKAHFSTQMGSTVNDYETYEIDSNGNQKLFYVGMSRYTLDYSNGTNHITKLSTKEPFGLPEETVKMYELDHDTLGNVSKAPHRNIQKITYHPVTNRPVYIELTDGRIIVIQYDAQGERILKRVYDSKEVLLTEVKYLRDERGNVLMDIRTKYAQTSSETTKVTTSTYLHGPRGLLGFTRNGKFYSVFSDHAGSVRLITQQGKVVAGYDYWPYGETMKVFGNEDAHIFYRFTGQEWDEEIGLYNFHARLYDPTLGRFFQPDPKSQYYSPYVYAGNSPISLVDPDGEFFLIFAAIIGAIIGAYLGGAAANGNWNPIKWNWKSLNTWLGIIGGGIGGAMLPGGFAALSATIGVPGAILVGLGGSFFSMAIQNENWNPAKWDWTNPGTYNAFFQGFGDGLSGGGVLDVVDQVKNIHRFAKTLGKTGQILFIASSYGLGFTLAYVNGALANENNFKFWEWDFKNPGTLAAIKGGFMFGSGLPKEALPMAKNFRDFIKNKDLKEIMKSMKTSSKQFFKTILKDKRHPLFKAVGKGLLNYLTITIEQCSSEDGDHCSFDITKWDWKSLSTYEGILNGILQNPDAVEMVQDYREGNLKIPKEKLFYNLTLKKKHVTYFLSALQRGMADIASFYFPKVPGLNNRKRNYVSPALFPLLARVIDSNTKSSENADGEGYEDQLRNLLDGISAGSKIYPDTSFGAYLDCHQRNVTMNGINRSIEFELCDIGNGPRKISLRNRELIYKLFVPSIKYRSNVHFFQVHPDVKEPEEFLDQFVTGIQKHLVSNSFFYTSYFAGATFNSLLNYLKVPNANSGTVFIRSEMLPNLDAPILHTALVSNSVVSVRVVVVGKKDDFQRVSDYMQVQQYRCQIPESFAENINSIETQVYFIDVEQTEDKANPWVYTMTPELSTDYLNCEAAPQFMQAKPIDGINSLLDDFETFLESGYDLDAQLQNFEVFVEDVKKLHNGVSEINIDSFLGFLYGLLDCNMKNTYDLKLELGMNESFSILARKTAEGHENWYGTAVVVMSTHDPAYVERSLYSLGTHTLSKHALLATFDNGNLTSKATEEIPTFESILGKNALITNQSIENGIKFIYYTNLDKSRTRQNQNDREFNFHYVSNSILGQFLAHANYKEADSVEISVFTPLSGTPYESRISSQRIFFVKHAETGNYTVINIIESSQGVDPVFNSDVPTNIPVLPLIDNEEVSTVRHLKIKLNINSIAAFSSEPSKATDFFHGIEDVNENISEIPTDSSSYFLLESSIENSIKKLSFDKESIQKLFVTLSENKFRPLTTSELDFNALASGFLLGMIHATTVDVDGIQLQLRNRVSKSFQDSSQEHNLLSVVSRDNSVVPQSTQVLAQNLKFSNESFDVETKFKEASIELQEHYCENRQRLSETWRFTSVPAVFGPKLERTIMFEVNPPSVVDGNCTAEINETNWQAYQKKVVEPFVTSSASKISENGFLNGIFKYFNKGVSSLPKILFDENEYTHSQFSTDKNENLKKEGVSENTVSCQNGAWVDRSYVMNGITCLSKLSKMTVFRITTDNDLTRENFGSLHQPFIGGDTFEKKSCAPVDFNGMPSVTCNGQKTNLVYTPYLQDRLFDNLDANILLGRTLIHLGGKVFGGPSAEERYFKKFGKEQVAISPDMIDILERKLVKIEGLIRDTARVNTNIKIYEELQWAHTKIKDCRDTLEEISKKRDGIIAREELEKIRERVEALHEDVKEQIADFKLSESKAGMYGGTRSEENESKTWSEGNSDTEFQSNSHVNINDFVARNYAGFVSSAANMFSGINVIS